MFVQQLPGKGFLGIDVIAKEMVFLQYSPEFRKDTGGIRRMMYYLIATHKISTRVNKWNLGNIGPYKVKIFNIFIPVGRFKNRSP